MSEIVKIPAPKYEVEAQRPVADDAGRECARRASEAVADGFDWAKTAEGFEFWDGVYKRLLQIGDGGPLR